MLSDLSLGASTQMASNEPGSHYQSDHSLHGSYDTNQHMKVSSRSQMTPPTTPNGSQVDLTPEQPAPPIFHNFLRAFYPFHPDYAVTDSSVTLPLDEGDVVLVHSVHTNGWADGTLLASGARGWLPTNYCEAYEPEDMRSLLKALLNFWDLLRSTSVNDSEMFRNQEFMKGIIAGVRYLLERTNCLNRESPIVQRSDSLRKGRKSLLSELSSLVKSAKRLQESQQGSLYPPEDVNDIIDEMILRAFKIVTKGVRFLDALEDDRQARAPAFVTVMATVSEEPYVPPTPPADGTTFDDRMDPEKGSTGNPAAGSDESDNVASKPEPSDVGRAPVAHWNQRMSSLNGSVQPASINCSLSNRNSQSSLNQNHRLSSGMTHRVSLAGPSPCSIAHHLVSERLYRSHDKFLSHLGSFIGRLHLQSQSRPELALAIKQSATSGGELLAVMDSVCAYSSSSIATLSKVRMSMFERIQDLVLSARDTLTNAATEGADLIMPQDNRKLLSAATGCVRAAGECVAKTKAAIERVGDFESELEGFSLDIDLSILDVAEERAKSPSDTERSDTTSSATGHVQTDEFSVAATLRAGGNFEKPLPRVPFIRTPGAQNSQASDSPAYPQPISIHEANASIITASVSSTRPALPPLPKLTTSLDFPDHTQLAHDPMRIEQDQEVSCFESLVASSAGSSGTYLSRDSEVSVVSQTSTRATTPDHTAAPRLKPSMSDLSANGSFSQGDDQDDVEARILEKTFAHELMFNKEGQVTGGSLPALVERLTTHESTPDATFVSSFYLTFRLFCTPLKLTEALIDRFDYVGEFPHMAGPVRLRVYNAFKGWLESHWRDQVDRDALKLIIPFAEGKLSAVLPSAGQRLLELARRVSGHGLLVPRLVSSMGKTNTTIAQFIPADTPIPQPAISKSQQHTLTAFRTGGSIPTILDFEPLELARQITIKQMGIFCSILPEELLASQWMKKGGVDAPNVKAMSALSTDLSNLVADTILQHSEIKRRAAVIKQWIKVAHQCLELHNYDGLMAIICSLNSSTISRLRKTWDAISPKRKDVLRHLQEIVEPAQNNKVLRTRLHDHVPPCLPFLGMYLTDLTFVDIGNPATKQMCHGTDSDEDGSGGLTVVNFDKHTRTAKIIGDLQRFQIPYRLTEVHEMQEWISMQIRRVREGDQGNVQVTYYRKSLLLEPRENAHRRDFEPPTPVTSTAGASRGDLFGWMTRDRGGQTAASAQG